MASATRPTDKKLFLGTKIGWGMADAGINVFVYLKAVLIINFMTSYLGISVGLAGLISLLVVLTDMVTDPLIGAWSDRTDSRFGRRRPFMIVGVILMLVLSYMTFAVPAGMSGTAAAIWVFVFYALASIGFTMVAVPFGAMATEMTENPQERVTMTGFRMAFASIGLLIAGLAFAPQTRADFAGSGWMVLGALMVIPVLISVLSTTFAPRVSSNGEVTAKGQVIAKATSPESPMSMAEQIRIVARSGPFIRHMVAYGIMTMGVAIISAGIRFITEDVVSAKAGAGDFATYLSQVELSNTQMIRLGLMEEETGGWTTRSGENFDSLPVVLNVTDSAFDFNALDYATLAEHPYGNEQIGALKGLLNKAIAAELAGPLAFLVNLAGLFSAIFALFLLGSVLSQFLWVPLAGIIGRDNTLVVGLIAYGLLLGGYLLVLRGDNLNLIVGVPFLLGMCNGCYQNLPWAILPTMIDKANRDEGRRVEGAFNGFWLTGQKAANAVGPVLFTTLLGFAGFASSTIGFQIQSATASGAMEMIMTVLPAIFFVIAIPLFLSIPKDLRR